MTCWNHAKVSVIQLSHPMKDFSFAEPGTAKLRPNNVVHTSKSRENESERERGDT